MRLSGEVTIEAPADRVWEIAGHQFGSIGEWATAIEASRPDGPHAGQTAAPVAGRACETGMRSFPTVSERIVAYDETNKTLTYVATGLPRFVREARNRWQISAAGPWRAHARFDGVLELHGVTGLLVAIPLRLWMLRVTKAVLDDLKHYAEHGTPSPRKERRLVRLNRTRPVAS